MLNDVKNEKNSESSNDLISLIYRSVLDPSCFPVLLESLYEYMESLPKINHSPTNKILKDTEHIKIENFINQKTEKTSSIEKNKNIFELINKNLAFPEDHVFKHFQQAVSMAKTIVDAEQEKEFNKALLEKMPMAMVLLDHDANILSLNRRAEKLIEESSSIVSIEGKLSLINSSLSCDFTKILKKLAVPRATPLEAIQFQVTGKIGEYRCSAFQTTANHIEEDKFAKICLMIDKLPTKESIDLSYFIKEYKLTRKEAEVTQLLIHGLKIKAIAEKNNSSIHTVRTQVKRILVKTNTGSQSELITHAIFFDQNINKTTERNQSSINNEAQTILLDDGRVMGYAEYGNLDGAPMVFCHGFMSSRLFHPDIQELIKQDIRFIVPDRPGYGLSDPNPKHSILDWTNDLKQLLLKKNIKKINVMADDIHSAYALACAKKIPQYIEKIILLDGACPPDEYYYIDSKNKNSKQVFSHSLLPRLAKYAPLLIKYLLHLSLMGYKKNPIESIRNTISCMDNPNQTVLMKEDFFQYLLKVAPETIRQGSTASAHNYILLLNSWGFELENIKTPVFMIYGGASPFSNFYTDQLASKLNNSHRIFIEGSCWASQFYEQWDEVINRVKQKEFQLNKSMPNEIPTLQY